MKVRKKFPSKVACVHCNGGCRANQSPEGYDLCLYGCTGCGACMEVCRFGAISLNSYGVAEVDESRCIGCGACYQACPQRVIHLRLEDNPIVVLCSNKDARCRIDALLTVRAESARLRRGGVRLHRTAARKPAQDHAFSVLLCRILSENTGT